jgi:Family of unknown function (DUF5677)
MATVKESVQTLETLCHCAISLSTRTQGRPTSNWQLLEGSSIFARNCLTCVSLLRLVPISSFYRPIEKLDVWDLPSVASLVRNIIETYHIFFYIVEGVSESECEARQALWCFHEIAERLRALQLGVPSSKGIDELKKDYLRRKVRLEASPFFQGLSNKQRNNLLNGRDSKFLTQNEIAERTGVSLNYLASCYKYCSNFIHTSPMAVAMMNTFRAGTPVGLERFKYVSDLATAFMALTIRDLVHLVPDQRAHINEGTWDTIRLWEGVLRNWERNSDVGD